MAELQTPDGLTPAEALEEVDADLAYTTVMTILTRLWKKGLVERHRQGRGFVYRAVVSEEDLAAQRMQEALRPVRDRAATLTRFVDSLSPDEERLLRRVIEER